MDQLPRLVASDKHHLRLLEDYSDKHLQHQRLDKPQHLQHRKAVCLARLAQEPLDRPLQLVDSERPQLGSVPLQAAHSALLRQDSGRHRPAERP